MSRPVLVAFLFLGASLVTSALLGAVVFLAGLVFGFAAPMVAWWNALGLWTKLLIIASLGLPGFVRYMFFNHAAKVQNGRMIGLDQSYD